MRNAETGSQAGHGLPLDGIDPGRDGRTGCQHGKGSGICRDGEIDALRPVQKSDELFSANAAADAETEHPGRGYAGGNQLSVVKEG